MPNCFSLTRKTEPEKGPVALNTIDEEMCAHFNEKPHEVEYFYYWYDWVGLPLAMGSSFAEIKERLVKERDDPTAVKMVEIVQWLDDNFTADAWAEIGRG